MGTATAPKVLGDVVKYEMPARQSRADLIVDASQTLKIGTVCGRGPAGRMKKVGANTNEVQTLAITGTLTAGSFTLRVLDKNGVLRVTPPIAFNANTAAIQAALDDALGASMVVAGGTAITASTLTFSGSGYAGKPQQLIEVDTSGLTGEDDASVTRTTQGGQAAGAGANEVQTMAIVGTLTAGTFTLTLTRKDGVKVTTATIAYNANNATIQTAVDNALGVANNCVVGGTAITANTFTFSGPGYANINQPMITVDITLLTGATGVTVTETTQGGPPGEGFASAICLQEITTGVGETKTRAAFLVRNAQVDVDQLDTPTGVVLADVVTALEKLGIQCLKEAAINASLAT